MTNRTWTTLIPASVAIVLALALAAALIIERVNNQRATHSRTENHDITIAPGRTTHAEPNKMIYWNPLHDGNPKTYIVGDYGLTFKLKCTHGLGNCQDILLTVRSEGHQRIVTSDNAISDWADGRPIAAAAVSHLDTATRKSQIVFATQNSDGSGVSLSVKVVDPIHGRLEVLELPTDIDELPSAVEESGNFKVPADLDGDGVPDIEIADGRFNSTFSCHACSWYPPLVYEIENGRLREQTYSQRVRTLIAADMTMAKAACLKRDGTQNGACAGYVADAARVGQFSSAWKVVLANYDKNDLYDQGCRVALGANYSCPQGQQKYTNFPEALAGFLTEWGYITPEQRALATDPRKIFCNGIILDALQLIVASPFANKGHCYRAPLMIVSQWFDDKTALVSLPMGSGPVLIDFPEPPNESLIFVPSAILVGEGAFQYQSVGAGMQTVARATFRGSANK
jgi:hypothetical protein